MGVRSIIAKLAESTKQKDLGKKHLNDTQFPKVQELVKFFELLARSKDINLEKLLKFFKKQLPTSSSVSLGVPSVSRKDLDKFRKITNDGNLTDMDKVKQILELIINSNDTNMLKIIIDKLSVLKTEKKDTIQLDELRDVFEQTVDDITKAPKGQTHTLTQNNKITSRTSSANKKDIDEILSRVLSELGDEQHSNSLIQRENSKKSLQSQIKAQNTLSSQNTKEIDEIISRVISEIEQKTNTKPSRTSSMNTKEIDEIISRVISEIEQEQNSDHSTHSSRDDSKQQSTSQTKKSLMINQSQAQVQTPRQSQRQTTSQSQAQVQTPRQSQRQTTSQSQAQVQPPRRSDRKSVV